MINITKKGKVQPVPIRFLKDETKAEEFIAAIRGGAEIRIASGINPASGKLEAPDFVHSVYSS
jgi:hypothetical protein